MGRDPRRAAGGGMSETGSVEKKESLSWARCWWRWVLIAGS